MLYCKNKVGEVGEGKIESWMNSDPGNFHITFLSEKQS